jgi:hypothetical protein
MVLKANTSLNKLVEDFSSELADFARWPEVPERIQSMNHDIAVLRQALKGFDPVVSHSIYLLLFSELIHDVLLREIPVKGLRAALLKVADVIAPA